MKITRRTFVETAAMTATMGFRTIDSFGEDVQHSKRQPNIILMLGDDHRASALGCMGNKIVKTPELDRLASEGILFRNNFCTTPICCVSRASIMLGQYASVHGINDFEKPLSPEQVSRAYYSLLQKAGYHTGFIGKFGVGKEMPSSSFDVWRGFGGQGKYFPEGESGPHLTNIIRDQAEEFLKSAPRDKPFCLSISHKAPHEQDEDPRQYLPSKETLPLYLSDRIPAPHGAPATDISRFPLAFHHSESRRRWGIRYASPEVYQQSMKDYYRLVSGIDSMLGRMREVLQREELADNTVIIYSADHGIFAGEHGFAGKWYAHEESIRTPLIIFDPRKSRLDTPAHREDMTLNIDLYPTILGFAGVNIPENTQGRDLMVKASTHRESFFVEHRFPDYGFIPSSDAVRTREWKYIRYTDNAAPFEELYDLRHDPFEMNNLVGKVEHAKQHEMLKAFCTKWKEKLVSAGGPWRDPTLHGDRVGL